ncbi:MAG: hypothetical protein HOQ12_01785 [Gemmatimonadaceae bacterium]|nr:hypothetical protein [Gemmatimonadaceae bacterium]
MRAALRWLRAHWKALASALTSLAGLVSEPDLLNLLPAKWAHALTVAGVVLLLFARAINAFPLSEDAPHA